MERAKRRRSYVLQQMADKGFITQKEADDAKERPIVLAGGRPADDNRPPTSSRKCGRKSRAGTAPRRCTKTA